MHSAFQELLHRHPDVDAILLSTNDGVPLLRGTHATSSVLSCLCCVHIRSPRSVPTPKTLKH